VLSAVALLALWAVPVMAQETFTACYVNAVGAMYLIKQPGLPTACLSTNHVEIEWSEQAGGAVITDGAVTTAKLADGAVTLAKLGPQAVNQALGMSPIGSAEILDNAIQSSDLQNDAVTTAKIADGAITAAKLAAGVGGGSIVDGSVTSEKLADQAVTGAKIADGAVTAEKIASGAVAFSVSTQVSSSFALTPGEQTFRIETCPASAIAVGGGWEHLPLTTDVIALESYPASNSQWHVRLKNIGAANGNVRVWLRCLAITP
jgi:hypothetical protein